MITRINALVASLLLVGCVSPVKNVSLTPEALNADSTKYDGQEVIVTGYLVIEAGKRSDLWQSQNKYENSGEINSCVTLRNNDVLPKPIEEINETTVTLSGTFRKNIIEGINLNLCNSAGLEIVSFVK